MKTTEVELTISSGHVDVWQRGDVFSVGISRMPPLHSSGGGEVVNVVEVGDEQPGGSMWM